MRFTNEQALAVHQVIKRFIAPGSYELYLYGSRTRDDLKGGDIDLLIVTNSQGVLVFNENKLTILVEIKKNSSIGQRRIDLIAHTQNELEQNPFLNSLRETLVLLGQG